MSSEFNLRELFFETWHGEFGRCFALGPEGLCEEPAIRAHSVQNARYLDLLATDNHLFELAPDYKGNSPEAAFRKVGRNRATTFAGLCADHDAALFRPIDMRPVDFDDPEHLFLLAYRAVLREVHATAAVGVKSQEIYQGFVEAGRAPNDQPSPIGLFATNRLIVAYETWMYMLQMAETHAMDGPRGVEHDVVRLTGVQPSLAASTLFSLDEIRVGDDVARACLSILPVSANETVAAFSYLQRDAGPVREALDWVLSSELENRSYNLSKLILNSCENFVLSPAVFQTWTDEKREVIRRLFMRTLAENDFAFDHEHLQLFRNEA